MILPASLTNALRERCVLTISSGAICRGRRSRSEPTANPKRRPTSATRFRKALGGGIREPLVERGAARGEAADVVAGSPHDERWASGVAHVVAQGRPDEIAFVLRDPGSEVLLGARMIRPLRRRHGDPGPQRAGGGMMVHAVHAGVTGRRRQQSDRADEAPVAEAREQPAYDDGRRNWMRARRRRVARRDLRNPMDLAAEPGRPAGVPGEARVLGPSRGQRRDVPREPYGAQSVVPRSQRCARSSRTPREASPR